MESTGTPEQVHISEETRKFLGDGYIFKEGDEVFGEFEVYILPDRMRDSMLCAIFRSSNVLRGGQEVQFNGCQQE